MQQTPDEVIIANLALLGLFVLAVIAVLVAGRRWQRVRVFRDKMLAQWKASLAIAVIYLVGSILGGLGLNLFGMVKIFCESLIGLALARSIAGYEPLPVTRSITRRERVWRSLGLMLGIVLLTTVAKPLIGSLGTGIGRAFGEVQNVEQAAGMFPKNKWQAFFLLLAGAGIAEETTYRLVLLSLFWRLTYGRWLAIITAAVLFGAYHLSPLNGMYLTFWQYPISQFFGSICTGTLWGYVYSKRGYETSVLGHTLSNWILILLFT